MLACLDSPFTRMLLMITIKARKFKHNLLLSQRIVKRDLIHRNILNPDDP
jgi:hypothetical protein